MDAAQVEPGRMTPYGALPVPHITPELLRLIKTGKVYSLGMPQLADWFLMMDTMGYETRSWERLSPCKRVHDAIDLLPIQKIMIK